VDVELTREFRLSGEKVTMSCNAGAFERAQPRQPVAVRREPVVAVLRHGDRGAAGPAFPVIGSAAAVAAGDLRNT
jgi:hypothetical protein